MWSCTAEKKNDLSLNLSKLYFKLPSFTKYLGKVSSHYVSLCFGRNKMSFKILNFFFFFFRWKEVVCVCVCAHASETVLHLVICTWVVTFNLPIISEGLLWGREELQVWWLFLEESVWGCSFPVIANLHIYVSHLLTQVLLGLNFLYFFKLNSWYVISTE